MKELQLAFTEFTRSYLKNDAEYDINIELKVFHSQRVAVLAELIAESEISFDRELAYMAALLHDIGRFEQYRLYESFNDLISDNHGELGYRILKRRNELLNNLPVHSQEIVLACVRYHNALTVPDELSAEIKRYIHLIRDADKIDIIDLFIKLFVSGEITECLVHKLPFTDKYTFDLAEKLVNGGMILSEELFTTTDFKLKLLSWFSDFEYQKGIDIVNEMKLPEKMRKTLPNDRLIDDVFHAVQKRMVPRVR